MPDDSNDNLDDLDLGSPIVALYSVSDRRPWLFRPRIHTPPSGTIAKEGIGKQQVMLLR